MMGIDDVCRTFSRFVLDLDKAGRLSQLEKLANGYEGWVKIEFLLWLAFKGFIISGAEADAGAEYKLSPDRRKVSAAIRKQCDLWVRAKAARASAAGYHYIEIKAPFVDANTKKVFASAATDLRRLLQMRKRYEQAVTASVIVLGVRFQRQVWDEAIAAMKEKARLNQIRLLERSRRRGPLFWTVFTHEFA